MLVVSRQKKKWLFFCFFKQGNNKKKGKVVNLANSLQGKQVNRDSDDALNRAICKKTKKDQNFAFFDKKVVKGIFCLFLVLFDGIVTLYFACSYPLFQKKHTKKRSWDFYHEKSKSDFFFRQSAVRLRFWRKNTFFGRITLWDPIKRVQDLTISDTLCLIFFRMLVFWPFFETL